MIFRSDNQTGASPKILDAISAAGRAAPTAGYGDDTYSRAAQEAIAKVFGTPARAFFVPTGTAANCLAISCLAKPWQAVLCHAMSHVALDESTAPEAISGGARVIGIDAGGKLLAADLEAYLAHREVHVPHNVGPAALSLTNAAESGLVYTPGEVRDVAAVAHRHGLHVHMDGARFANAVVGAGCDPADVTWRAGVDVLSLGATKNGCLMAEAVVFFNLGLAADFEHRRKRFGHLVSKGRFFGAQFLAWLDNGHWLDLARHANAMARRLADGLAAISPVRIAWPVEANEVFIVLPASLAAALRSAGAEFYDWYPRALPHGQTLRDGEAFVRMVCSHATTADEVAAIIAAARRLA